MVGQSIQVLDTLRFNGELFVTDIYKRVFRGSVKDSLKRRRGLPHQIKKLQVRRRSRAIDRTLVEDSRRLRRECKVLLTSAAVDIVKHTEIVPNGGGSTRELTEHRNSVRLCVAHYTEALVETMRRYDIESELDVNKRHLKSLLDCDWEPKSDVLLKETVAETIDALWKDPLLTRTWKNGPEAVLSDSPRYFFEDIRRIHAPDYIPTVADILKSPIKPTGIQEARLWIGHLAINFIACSARSLKIGAHRFDDFISIIYVADLACYDETPFESPNQTRMQAQLFYIESIVTCNWRRRPSIILFLDNVSALKQKLAAVPLENYFPDYSSGTDVTKATTYLLGRFKAATRGELEVYAKETDLAGTSDALFAVHAIQDTIPTHMNNTAIGSS